MVSPIKISYNTTRRKCFLPIEFYTRKHSDFRIYLRILHFVFIAFCFRFFVEGFAFTDSYAWAYLKGLQGCPTTPLNSGASKDAHEFGLVFHEKSRGKSPKYGTDVRLKLVSD